MTQRTFHPHVTVAALVEKDHRFLLVRESIDGEEKLNNPAGHLEAGESPEEATVRECYEETGYRLSIEALLSIHVWRSPSDGDTFVRFNYLGKVGQRDEQAQLDTGVLGPVWLTQAEAQRQEDRMRSPLVLLSIREYLAGIRHPLGLVTTFVES